MLGILYCSRCRSALCQYGDIVNALFEQVCEHYILTGKGLEFCLNHNNDTPFVGILDFLEKKGYVLSTETDKDFIQVKPLGIEHVYEYDDEQSHFCLICFDTESHDYLQE